MKIAASRQSLIQVPNRPLPRPPGSLREKDHFQNSAVRSLPHLIKKQIAERPDPDAGTPRLHASGPVRVRSDEQFRPQAFKGPGQKTLPGSGRGPEFPPAMHKDKQRAGVALAIRQMRERLPPQQMRHGPAVVVHIRERRQKKFGKTVDLPLLQNRYALPQERLPCIRAALRSEIAAVVVRQTHGNTVDTP